MLAGRGRAGRESCRGRHEARRAGRVLDHAAVVEADGAGRTRGGRLADRGKRGGGPARQARGRTKPGQ